MAQSGRLRNARFEIEAIQFMGFSNKKGDDVLANKGVLGLTLNIGNNHQIKVFNTHMQAYEGAKFQETRALQLTQLKEMISQNHTPSMPTMIAGDFNFSCRSEEGKPTSEYNELMPYLGEDFKDIHYLNHDESGARTTPTQNPAVKGSWYDKSKGWGTSKWTHEAVEGCILDHIFLYKTKTASLDTQIHKLPTTAPSGLSDHLPLTAELTLF